MKPRNRFQGMNSASLCSLAGRCVKAIPPQFLAPIDSLKIPALWSKPVYLYFTIYLFEFYQIAMFGEEAKREDGRGRERKERKGETGKKRGCGMSMEESGEQCTVVFA